MNVEVPVILLVEDNPDDEILTIRAFQKSNLKNEIVVARDGVEALDYLLGTGSYSDRDPSDTPHLILLDLKLPKLDGLEVLRRIRVEDVTRLLPVIVLTTSAEQEDVIKSYEMGANSYVRKPVDFNQFIDAIQRLGMYWLVLNKLPRK
jgi:two-component system response regulator